MALYSVLSGPSHQELMFALHDPKRRHPRCVRFKLALPGDDPSLLTAARETTVHLHSFAWAATHSMSLANLAGVLTQPFCLNGFNPSRHRQGSSVMIAYDLHRRTGSAGITEVIQDPSVVAAASPSHECVFVTYQSLPPVEELEREFSGPGSVSAVFEGLFVLDDACANIPMEPGEKWMRVMCLGEPASSAEAIQQMDPLWRPATHLEARDFAHAFPNEQFRSLIAALGSYTMYRGKKHAATLRSACGQRLFDVGTFEGQWGGDVGFLCVKR